MRDKLYLVLENGEVFEGKAFGAQVNREGATGEVVFTTAMAGCTETLTDPSYSGQMVVQTFPMAGNYGYTVDDFESNGLHLAAYIVREWCAAPSNFRSEGDIDGLLKRFNIPGLCGVDTRELTKIIRDAGALNGMLTDDPLKVDTAALAAWSSGRVVERVSTLRKHYLFSNNAKYKVAVWDFGVKRGMTDELLRRGCELVVFPVSACADDILAEAPDGILLTNGPGDPAVNTGVIGEAGKLAQTGLPMMGICLGHQVMALAMGGGTEKLKYGHRGANHSARDVQTGKTYITSQNHGYTVNVLPPSAKTRFENVNDGTCEGIDYTDIPAFSVQFHPEARGGPLDTGYLFGHFISMMGGDA